VLNEELHFIKCKKPDSYDNPGADINEVQKIEQAEHAKC
jgi:hypothetical protein